MIKTLVYHKENLLGEVELYKINLNNGVLDDLMMNRREKGIRISHFSQPSERCPPLAVLHTISSNGVCFKMVESTPPPYSVEGGNTTPLMGLHLACLRDNKTAVMSLGDEELHLVAMQLRQMGGATPCFWGFSVATGLYQSCLGMLNLRCLGIVFDLDETLIVANTMRSFEDRIESLQRKIDVEMDPQRVAGMMAEVKRYQEDKAILKQYIENDQVVDSGEVFRIQSEVVPAMSDNRQPIVRPIIRLPDKNVILTRINPQIRDTSVLVRLRPAWEDLRNYLTARGRKRFEVYVCTMAERDYALEMWRLLDPNSNLIHTRELLDRIVCVKSGSKKSLFNVFHDGICHPKMALVIDDRLKVWDEEDQPRIHVVPPFAPYYAPQAEANNAIPVLCVARNVACNVRGGFFKEFDESLLQRISGVLYEDDLSDIPSPDVSNYLVSEDEESGLNGNREPLGFDGMADAEVERRLKEAISASSAIPPAVASTGNSLDPRLSSTLTFAIPAPPVTVPQPAPQGFLPPFSTIQFPQAAPSVRPPDHVSLHDPGLRGSPATEEGEVPESELDPDTRRRLLILQHGQDIRDHAPPEPQLPVRPPSQAPIPAPGPVPVSAPQVQSHGGWFLAEDRVSPDPLNRALTKEYPSIPDVVHAEKQRPHCPPFPRKMDSSIRSERFFEKQRFPREVRHRDERTRSNHSPSSHQSNPGDRVAKGQSSSGNRDLDIESKQGPRSLLSPAGALREIALKCGTEVDFKPALVATTELKFYMEVYFAGEKIGEGNGTTRRDAQHQAAETSLKNLSGKYLEHIKSDLNFPREEASAAENTSESGLANDVNSYDERSLSEPTRSQESSLEDSKKSASSVSALKELCMMEGLGFDFRADLSTSSNGIQKDEVHAEVEIDGQVWRKGTGLTWDEAKMQAAETALESRKSMLGQLTRKQPESPRSLEAPSSKRMKPEYPEILQ